MREDEVREEVEKDLRKDPILREGVEDELERELSDKVEEKLRKEMQTELEDETRKRVLTKFFDDAEAGELDSDEEEQIMRAYKHIKKQRRRQETLRKSWNNLNLHGSI